MSFELSWKRKKEKAWTSIISDFQGKYGAFKVDAIWWFVRYIITYHCTLIENNANILHGVLIEIIKKENGFIVHQLENSCLTISTSICLYAPLINSIQFYIAPYIRERFVTYIDYTFSGYINAYNTAQFKFGRENLGCSTVN